MQNARDEDPPRALRVGLEQTRRVALRPRLGDPFGQRAHVAVVRRERAAPRIARPPGRPPAFEDRPRPVVGQSSGLAAEQRGDDAPFARREPLDAIERRAPPLVARPARDVDDRRGVGLRGPPPRVEIPRRREGAAPLVRALGRQVQAVSRGLGQRGEEQTFLVVARELFRDLVAQRRFNHAAIPVAQERVLANHPREDALVHPQHEQDAEGRAAGGHRVQDRHPAGARIRDRDGGRVDASAHGVDVRPSRKRRAYPIEKCRRVERRQQRVDHGALVPRILSSVTVDR